MGTKRLSALPPRYCDPFYRGRGRGKGRGRGRREWLNERPFERESNRGFGRGFSHGNGRGNGRGFHPQATSVRDQRDRQEEEWSIPTSVGRRGEDIPVGLEILQRIPPMPVPSEDRFTDWSSLGLGSPHVRTPPQSVPIRETGPDINQPPNQTTQPGSEPTQIGVTENALQEYTIVSSPRTQQQLPDQLSVTNERRMMDMGTNTSDMEVRSHRDGTRVLTLDANAQASLPIIYVMLPSDGEDQVAIPEINLSILGYGPNSLRDSH